jgi:ribosomal protein S12 methylthiotransferase
MERVYLLTLGCPKNLADSELMLGVLAQSGFALTTDPESADVLVVNTCAFIEAAKKESLEAILEAAEVKRHGAGRRLVVSGCLAQRYGAELREQLPEVDIFVGTGNFLELPELLRRTQDPERRALTYAGAAHVLPSAQIPRVRTGNFFSTYLKVSEGCDHKCAFCIIPKIRGNHESRALNDIAQEAEALVEAGARELNLIAQDLTAYGRDLRPQTSLTALLRRLNDIQGLHWIRLLYCYPNSVTNELLETVAELPKVTKYLDMPLQHADDNILRAMKRERGVDALNRLLDRVRERIPGVALRSSFIVGFPGESDQAFQNLADFIRRQRFDRVGVFTYSKEEDTLAAAMENQVAQRVKRDRRRQLMEIQAEVSKAKNKSWVGREVEVLVEGELPARSSRMHGRTAHQAPEIDGMVILRGEAAPGEFVKARIEQARTYDLVGTVVQAVA